MYILFIANQSIIGFIPSINTTFFSNYFLFSFVDVLPMGSIFDRITIIRLYLPYLIVLLVEWSSLFVVVIAWVERSMERKRRREREIWFRRVECMENVRMIMIHRCMNSPDLILWKRSVVMNNVCKEIFCLLRLHKQPWTNFFLPQLNYLKKSKWSNLFSIILLLHSFWYSSSSSSSVFFFLEREVMPILPWRTSSILLHRSTNR